MLQKIYRVAIPKKAKKRNQIPFSTSTQKTPNPVHQRYVKKIIYHTERRFIENGRFYVFICVNKFCSIMPLLLLQWVARID